MRRLRELSEAECYARCYGAGDDAVRVLRAGPDEAPPPPRRLSGEDVRLLFAPREHLARPHGGALAPAVATAS